MSKKPYFSVVIPLYNKEDQISSTLSSVLEQSFQDFEVVIVNDGSTDSSVDIVSAFKDQRIRIINKKNEGASIARNFGIQNSQGEYLALLDADDIWFPNHLEDLNRLINKYPNCGLYCTAYDTFFYDKKVVKDVYSGINKDFCGVVPDYFANSLINEIALTSAVAIPQSILEKHGNFNVNLRSGQDTELWIRIALKEKVAFSSEISMRRIILNSGNHLSLSNKRIDRLKILDAFKKYEKTNKSFKTYMDVNRYAIALECKMKGDLKNFKTIKKDIDLTSLNLKQKFVLKLPGYVLNALKKFQVAMIKNDIYLTTFR